MGVASEVTLGGWGFTSEGRLVPRAEWKEEGGEGGSGELLLEETRNVSTITNPQNIVLMFAEGADDNTHTSLQLPGPRQEVEEAEVGSPPCCFHL